MKISVVLPDELGADLERLRRQERTTTSRIVREALVYYLRDHRRKSVGEALNRAAERSGMTGEKVWRALAELKAERGRADRL
jgi:metal-responsive CopG/Arc/MetJ family transcriptional regulator